VDKELLLILEKLSKMNVLMIKIQEVVLETCKIKDLFLLEKKMSINIEILKKNYLIELMENGQLD